MLKTAILDGEGSGRSARISSRGELVVGPIEYSSFYSTTLDLINKGYNLVLPIAGFNFIITAVIVYGNKNVGANDATFTIYEATSASSATVVKTVLQQELQVRGTFQLFGVQVLVTEGMYLNAKTDDDDVFINLAGYYIPANR